MSIVEAGKEVVPASYTLKIDPRKDLSQFCQKLGVEIGDLDLKRISAWPSKVELPTKIYTAKLNLVTGKSWEKTVAGFKDRETGGTVLECLELVELYPEVLNGQEILLPGSAYGLYDIVKIYKEDGKIKLGHQWVSYKSPVSQAILSSKR